MKFRIVDVKVSERSGENDKGKWVMHEQEAYADLGKAFPVMCKINLPKERGGTPYPAGEYELDFSRSIEVGGYYRLQFAREIHLTPVSAGAETSRPASAARV